MLLARVRQADVDGDARKRAGDVLDVSVGPVHFGIIADPAERRFDVVEDPALEAKLRRMMKQNRARGVSKPLPYAVRDAVGRVLQECDPAKRRRVAREVRNAIRGNRNQRS